MPELIDADRIYLFEEHSSTLPVWWANRAAPRTVVYVDAHLDLQQTDPVSLAALQACSRLDEVLRLEAPSHLDPSDRYAYGIENFLYAAHRTGLIERLVWVAPPHIPRRYSASLVGYMQQMDGISFDELTGFRDLGNGALRGSLLGLDITICDYDRLHSLGIGHDYYLDIDIDYFVEVPADRLWIDPATVVGDILTQLGAPSLVTISRAVGSGFMPAAFRFVGDYVFSQLRGPKTDFDYYRNLFAAIRHMDDGDPAAGREICDRLVRERPDLAAAGYILALASTDGTEKTRLLRQAGERDPAYGFDLAREVMGLLHRKKSLDAGKIGQLTQALDELEPGQPQRQPAEIAMAQLLAACGDSKRAMDLLRQQAGEFAEHDEILLGVAVNQLADRGRRAETRDLLRTVCRSRKNATIARLYLGDLDFADGEFEDALGHYELAHRRAPAWMLPLERMSACFRQLQREPEVRETDAEIARRKRIFDDLLRLHGA